MKASNTSNKFNDDHLNYKTNDSSYACNPNPQFYLKNPPYQSQPPNEEKTKNVKEVAEFSITNNLLEKINVYLIGFEGDTNKYFQLLTENFRFLKKIDTNFKNVENDIKIENPSLAITLSLDYLGRLQDQWGRITEYIYKETGKIITKILVFKEILRWKSRNCEIN